MPRGFVIQPFDGAKFDKRFDDTFAPALEAAGFEPYRVDRDISVDVPIDSIEQGIRDSIICLADITSDNPNVWYELGFAFAAERPVILVCSDERDSDGFPFDIRHRAIILYKSESERDYKELKKNITDRAKVLLQKNVSLKRISENEQIAPQDGFSQPELVILAILAGETAVPASTYSTYLLQKDAEGAGLTTFAFGLGFRRLLKKQLIEIDRVSDIDGDVYDAAYLTTAGWDWVDSNENFFLFSHKQKSKIIENDDIPF